MISLFMLDVLVEGIEVGSICIEIDCIVLDFKCLFYCQGCLVFVGQVCVLDVGWVLELVQQFIGMLLLVKIDLVLDSDWDFNLVEIVSGYLQIVCKLGDVWVIISVGEVVMGLFELQLCSQFQGECMNVIGCVNVVCIGMLDFGGDIGLCWVDMLLVLVFELLFNLKVSFDVLEFKCVGDLIGL